MQLFNFYGILLINSLLRPAMLWAHLALGRTCGHVRAMLELDVGVLLCCHRVIGVSVWGAMY
jgi:hypothetical protein